MYDSLFLLGRTGGRFHCAVGASSFGKIDQQSERSFFSGTSSVSRAIWPKQTDAGGIDSLLVLVGWSHSECRRSDEISPVNIQNVDAVLGSYFFESRDWLRAIAGVRR